MRTPAPIIAVQDVERSSAWYQTVFDFQGKHGGPEFEVLCGPNSEVMLCLHRWQAHDHPTMQNPTVAAGNGLILYFRTDDLQAIRQRLHRMGHPVDKELATNPNSGMEEFSVRDPDNYYLTVSKDHNFGL